MRSARVRFEAEPVPETLNGLGADRTPSQWGTRAGLRPPLPEDHDHRPAFRDSSTRHHRVGELVAVDGPRLPPPHQRLHGPRQWGAGIRLRGQPRCGHDRVPEVVKGPMGVSLSLSDTECPGMANAPGFSSGGSQNPIRTGCTSQRSQEYPVTRLMINSARQSPWPALATCQRRRPGLEPGDDLRTRPVRWWPSQQSRLRAACAGFGGGAVRAGAASVGRSRCARRLRRAHARRWQRSVQGGRGPAHVGSRSR